MTGTGKGVWEIIAAVHDNDDDAAETARYLELPLGLVQAAISDYGAYRLELGARHTHSGRWSAGVPHSGPPDVRR